MHTFTKAERLSGKVAIDLLFKKGFSFHNNVFEIRWLEISKPEIKIQIVISAPSIQLLIKQMHRKL